MFIMNIGSKVMLSVKITLPRQTAITTRYDINTFQYLIFLQAELDYLCYKTVFGGRFWNTWIQTYVSDT